MPKSPRSKRESEIRLEPVEWLSLPERRRVQGALKDLAAQDAREQSALGRKMKELQSEYRANLSALLGPDGSSRYSALQKRIAKAPRVQRIHESSLLLEEMGFDRARGQRIQRKYLDAARTLVAAGADTYAPPSAVLDTGGSPWVTYTAPFAGSFWSSSVERSANVSDPALGRYLDRLSGQMESSIESRLGAAGDDDSLDVQYYTALYAWHTALANGPLEGYLAFAFRASTYSGQVVDEWGFSDAVWNQYARARFRVADPQGTADVQDSRIFATNGAVAGSDRSWDGYAAVPNDIHWYYFRTGTAFAQGDALLLEAGVLNATWFTANDESIEMADNIDLRLERIMVRSV